MVARRWISWFSLRCGIRSIIASVGNLVENKSLFDSCIALIQKNILLFSVDRPLAGQRRRTVDDQHSTNRSLGESDGGADVLSADAVSVRLTEPAHP